MTRRGRKARLDPPVEWKISIPKSIADAVEARLYDPYRQKVYFGARSTLLRQLLAGWLERKEREDKVLEEAFKHDGSN